MPATTPPLKAPRVRPLWEAHKLFREPAFDPVITLDDKNTDEDTSEDDDPPAPRA